MRPTRRSTVARTHGPEPDAGDARRPVRFGAGQKGWFAMSDKVYLAGLDLGRPHEFTALSVLERTEVPDPDNPERRVRHYGVRHLERLPPATPYPEVFARLIEVFAAPPLRGSKLVVDLSLHFFS